MKISIVVPIYNVEQYLERCIVSLINQTYKNIEILLINDGSKDNSIEICNKYEKADNRIKVFTKKNGGLSDARNYGLKYATGEYVLFIDSDDYIELDSCEKFINIVKKNGNIDIISSNAIVNTNNQISYMKHSNYASDEKVSGLNYFSHEVENKCMHISSCINMYRIGFLNANNLYFKKGILHEDEEFVPRAFLEAHSVMHLNYNFYNYMIRKDSITTHDDFSKNAFHLFNTLHQLEPIYDSIQNDKIKNILKNELCEKYLYMMKKLNDTNSIYDEEFDFEFLKRNAICKRTKNKLKLMMLNKNMYFFINNISHQFINDIKNLLDKKNIFYTLMMFLSIFFLSRFFHIYVKDGTIGAQIYAIMSKILFLSNAIVFIFYLRKTKFDLIIFTPIIYQIIIFIINIVDKGYSKSIISNGYPIVGLILLVGVCFKHDYRHTIIGFNWIFLILTSINLLLMIFCNQCFGNNVYFLGGRNQLAIVYIIGLLIAYLYDMEFNFKYCFKYSLIITTFAVIIGGSMNNLMALSVIYLYLFCNKYKKCKNRSATTITTLFSYIFFSVSIIIIHVEKYFSIIIENVFHRSISFSGRTFLWDAAIEKIKISPMLGYGRGMDTNYFAVDYFSNRIGNDKYMSAHNAFLQSMYEFGFFPALFIMIYLFYYLKKTEKFMIDKSKIVFPLLFSLLLILTFEAVPFDCLFFFITFSYLGLEKKINKVC